MIQAIFGLVGVLVGGLVTAGVQERQRRLTAGAARRLAARIVLDELIFYKTGLDVALDMKAYDEVDDPTKLETTWREHRNALEQLPWEEWQAISLAIVNALLVGSIDEEWAETDESMLSRAREKISAATTVLERHVE